jgi:hypothetical protein
MRDAGNENDSRQLMAFCMGHISHLATDTIVHPYVNMFGGDTEEIETYYSSFHRTTEVTQDSWLAKTYFGRDHVFEGESWTHYIADTKSFSEKLEDAFNNAYQAVYRDQPPEGFISNAHNTVIELVADSAFDNELYSVRMPLIFLSGALPFLLGGLLPGFAWAMPWSPYLRLTRDISFASVEELDPVLRKLIVPKTLDARLQEIPKAELDEIEAAIGIPLAGLYSPMNPTIDDAMRILGPLSLKNKLAVLDALDADKIRSGACVSIGLSGLASLWDWISETFWPDHWDTYHIVMEPITWAGMIATFFTGYFGNLTALKVCAPIYYACSAFQGAFSLDKTLYSKLTGMSIIPPKDPKDHFVRHKALPEGEATGAFYRDVLLNKSIERTRDLWRAAIQFYNDASTPNAGIDVFRDALKNWNIDTGYRIEAAMKPASTTPSGEDTVEVSYIHSWKEFDVR